MELYLRWLDRYERRPGEEPPIGLILCSEKNREQIELLQLDRGEIRVVEYLVELPPRKMLEARMHEDHTAGERAGGEWVRELKYAKPCVNAGRGNARRPAESRPCIFCLSLEQRRQGEAD